MERLGIFTPEAEREHIRRQRQAALEQNQLVQNSLRTQIRYFEFGHGVPMDRLLLMEQIPRDRKDEDLQWKQDFMEALSQLNKDQLSW